MNCRSAAYIAGFLNIDIDNARAVRAIIKDEISPDNFKSVQDWCRQCFNEPSKHEKKMCALNEAIGGFGSEAIFENGELWPSIEYINTGDTYSPTVVYYDGRYHFSTWGDIVERAEREGIAIA